jgi:hypothetical protein
MSYQQPAPSWGRKAAAWIGGLSLVVSALTALAISLDKLEHAVSPELRATAKDLLIMFDLAQETAPVPFASEERSVNWRDGPCCIGFPYNAPKGYIIVDAQAHFIERVRSVKVSQEAEINATRTSASAGWVANDPGGGTNSSARVNITGHITPENAPLVITALGWTVMVGSAVVGVAFLSLRSRTPHRPSHV